MAEAKKLGELLKDAGLIDNFQLESALSHQRNWGGRLGAVLVEMEFVSEADVAKVIAEKLRIPYANLFAPEISEATLKLIKPELAKKYAVVPVKKEPGGVVVAMSDPLDIGVIDELRFITGFNIKPALALESEIKDAIRKYYDHEEVARKATVAPSFKEMAKSSSGKMEIIHGTDLGMAKQERDPSSAILSKDESSQQAQLDSKMRLDALISLLIEKGLITREEIVSMIYQKKMGL
jgi:type IV pilus assembly protein PilB